MNLCERNGVLANVYEVMEMCAKTVNFAVIKESFFVIAGK